MWQRLLIVTTVFVFGITFFCPSSGFAEGVACEQADLEGTWSVIVGAMDEFGNHVCWEECTLTLDVNGFIQPAGTYLDCSQATADITAGQLLISVGCLIEGTVETSNGSIHIDTGAVSEPGQLVLRRSN